MIGTVLAMSRSVKKSHGLAVKFTGVDELEEVGRKYTVYLIELTRAGEVHGVSLSEMIQCLPRSSEIRNV